MGDLVWLSLVLIGLVGGIGIAALGPGGVLVTIGLFALTDLSPSAVAGTAIVTHVATGLMGTAVYLRSGQLRDPATRRMSTVLAVSSIAGTLAGVLLNTVLPGGYFGPLLGGFIAIVALLVLYRDRYDRRLAPAGGPPRTRPRRSLPLLISLGIGISVVSGLFGVGGPMIAVPVLVAIGVPLLPALAASQAQSIIIALVGSIGYASLDAIDWPLALLVGIPEVIGVVIGWRIAHSVPTRGLTYGLVVVLLALVPYLMLR